jgi:hypothetical protein
MVIFQTPDGNPGYNQFESLEEAVRFVEKLRNEQGVETARMFALEEVKFEFKSYFRVELDPLMVGPATESTPSDETPPSEPFGAPVRPDVGGFAPPPPVETSPFAEPAGVGTAPPPPTFMTVPGDDQGEQTTRRGLFGR